MKSNAVRLWNGRHVLVSGPFRAKRHDRRRSRPEHALAVGSVGACKAATEVAPYFDGIVPA